MEVPGRTDDPTTATAASVRPSGPREDPPVAPRKPKVRRKSKTPVKTPSLLSQYQQRRPDESPSPDPWPDDRPERARGCRRPPIIVKQEAVEAFGGGGDDDDDDEEEEEDDDGEEEEEEVWWQRERPGYGRSDVRKRAWGEREPPCSIEVVVKEEDDDDVEDDDVEDDDVEEVEGDVGEGEVEETDEEQFVNNEGYEDDDTDGSLRVSVRSVPCPLCGDRFLCHSVLQDHLEWKHGSKIKKHQCHLCPYSTNRKANMRIHQRIHTGEKPFKCTLCDKAFTQAGHLRKHQKTHLRFKPFKCTLCGRGYSRLGNLKRHQYKGHGKLKNGEDRMEFVEIVGK